MNRNNENIIELDERDVIIIEMIDKHLEGISFNKLASAVAENMSKVTLSSHIKKLGEIGMIMETKDPHHRQKKVYKSTTNMKELVNILGQIDSWAQSQMDRLQTIELIVKQGVKKNNVQVIEGLTEILGEIGIPMIYVLQIRLRYNLSSAMLLVPRAIEAANTILERMIELLDVHPNISEKLSRYMNAETYATIVERISKRYLTRYEGIIAYSNIDK